MEERYFFTSVTELEKIIPSAGEDLGNEKILDPFHPKSPFSISPDLSPTLPSVVGIPIIVSARGNKSWLDFHFSAEMYLQTWKMKFETSQDS